MCLWKTKILFRRILCENSLDERIFDSMGLKDVLVELITVRVTFQALFSRHDDHCCRSKGHCLYSLGARP